ncbi:MAG: calcium/proton exchanger [Gemmatimonadota bacterium]|nr:calcium/proton exchanger [Gemmatimonadota bacterium]
MTFLILLLLVPASLALEYVVHASPLCVFAAAVLAIVPLAEWIRRATEQLARVAGPAIGGLLNVTFGNVAELVIALFVLRSGHADVVKAQITGSIIGNSLLGLGLAIVVGSWGRERQTFPGEKASLLSSLFMLSVIALLVPAMFDYSERGLHNPAIHELDEWLSLVVSVVLIAVYVANLFYTLVTRRDVFAPPPARESAPARKGAWTVSKSAAVLLAATAAIAWEAELVSGALDATAHSIGISTFFLGIIVLAVIGNAAEYISAIYFARRDQMGLVMTITVGSSIQVALVTAPVLVLVSYLMGNPMNLVFGSPLELVAIGAAAVIVNAITRDGETTWIEGVLLLAVYVVLGTTFFLVSP